jgi:hypothetical protein
MTPSVCTAFEASVGLVIVRYPGVAERYTTFPTSPFDPLLRDPSTNVTGMLKSNKFPFVTTYPLSFVA